MALGPISQVCYCYILQCADGSFYTGWTIDPDRRLREHNGGRGARYTRARLPVELVFLEPQEDRASAMKRELAIKRMSRTTKERLIRESPKRARERVTKSVGAGVRARREGSGRSVGK